MVGGVVLVGCGAEWGAGDMEMDMADLMLHHKSVWLGGVEVREEVYASDFDVRFFLMVHNEDQYDRKKVTMGKDSAIAAARAILRHFNEGME